MKHLLNFDTVAEYNAAKDSLEQPYVVTIDENNGLQYNTDVIRVPEGQGGGSGSSDWHYYDLRNTDFNNVSSASTKEIVLIIGLLYKDEESNIYASADLNDHLDKIAFATDFNANIIAIKNTPMTIRELMNIEYGPSGTAIQTLLSKGVVEITEEEFYAI